MTFCRKSLAFQVTVGMEEFRSICYRAAPCTTPLFSCTMYSTSFPVAGIIPRAATGPISAPCGHRTRCTVVILISKWIHVHAIWSKDDALWTTYTFWLRVKMYVPRTYLWEGESGQNDVPRHLTDGLLFSQKTHSVVAMLSQRWVWLDQIQCCFNIATTLMTNVISRYFSNIVTMLLQCWKIT